MNIDPSKSQENEDVLGSDRSGSASGDSASGDSTSSDSAEVNDAGDGLVEALNDSSETSFVVEGSKKVSRGTLAMFAILVFGAGLVYFMYRKTGPQAAVAATSKETADAKKTINTFLSDGDWNMKAMEQMLRNTQKVVQQFLSYPSMTQVPLSDLRTNPFRFKSEAPKAGEGGGANDAAEKKRREEERVAILKSVQGLQLQSIMFSDARKACMVNNTLYKEGAQIESFTVEKINQNSVVVKNGPYRFELKMQR